MHYISKHCNHSAKALICLFISIFAFFSSSQPVLSPFAQLPNYLNADSIRVISMDGDELTVLHIAELYRTHDIRWCPQE